MTTIRGRKHPATRQPRIARTVALTTLALGMPATALAQAQAQAGPQAQAASHALPTVQVTGARDSDFKVDEAASRKFTAPLVDTPKSVTVVPVEVLRQTNAATMRDALRTVPGITFGLGEGGTPEGDRPILRGFDTQSSTFVDGLRDPSSQSRDMFNVEQIDVIKGPDSAYSGGGAVGGSINLTSKQAGLVDFSRADLGLGSASYKRGALDVNRRLGEHSGLRLNLMKEKSDVAGRDEVFVDRLGAALSLNMGLGTPTRLGLDLYHFETDDMPDYGIPYNNPYDPASPEAVFNGDGGPLAVDRENFYGLLARDFRNTDVNALTVRVEHDFGANWTFSNRSRASRSLNDYVVTNPGDTSGVNLTDSAFVNRGTLVAPGFLNRTTKNRYSTSTSLINATELRGRLATGAVTHRIATGIELSSLEVDSRGYIVTGSSTASIANPNPHDPWTGTVERRPDGNVIKTSTVGVYAFDTIVLDDQWQLSLGTRWDRFRSRQRPYTTDGSATDPTDFIESDESFWSYQAGVVYKPAPNGSVYVNLATSANPSGITSGDGSDNLSATNADLEPEKTRAIELGTKWNLLENRLALSAAVFEMEKTNAKVNVAPGVLENAGELRVRGVELGASGRITDRWQAFGGYTWLDSEQTDPGPEAPETRGKRFPNTPTSSFTLWTSYQLLPKLLVGGGAFYTSKVYGNTANTKWVPAWWRFDAMASYELSKNVSLRLNLLNLTDKTYYDRAYRSHMVTVAPGRQATLTASFRF